MTNKTFEVQTRIKKKNIPIKEEKVELFPYGLVEGLSHIKPIFLLSDKDNKDFLPVWVDLIELESLAHYFQEGSMNSHPYETHVEIFKDLGWEIDRLEFKKIDGYRLYGNLILKKDSKEKSFYKRAEDIILLALYSETKMFASSSLIRQAKEVKNIEDLKVIEKEVQSYKDKQKYLM